MIDDKVKYEQLNNKVVFKENLFVMNSKVSFSLYFNNNFRDKVIISFVVLLLILILIVSNFF